jgi:ribonuclease P protein component
VLPRQARVRTRPEFAAVVRRGRRSGTRTVVLSLLADTSATAGARAGFVVGRSVGRAVVRNQVRRRLRHIVAARLTELPAGSALVVRALPAAASASSAALAADVDRAVRRCLGAR